MSVEFLIALKNIKANSKRSIITIILSVISTAILIFASTLMDGEHKTLLKNAVEIYPGYIQITHKNFIDDPSYENLIFDEQAIISKLKKDQNIVAITPRFETSVLLSFGNKSVGMMLVGIVPQSEAKISKLKNSLIEGKYLDKNDSNALYIGAELAKRLKARIGDTLSFIGSCADYSFCADNVKIKGIFKTGLYEFDANSAFLNKSYFDEVFVSKNIATHIIVLPKHRQQSLKISQQIQQTLNDEYISKSWQELMESLVRAMELDSVFGYFTLAIFFIVIFFVILIYTFLVIFARIKEIGVLRAIGTSSQQIFKMLLYESVILAFVSVIIGGLIGAYLAYYFNINPIELGAKYEEQFKQYGLVSSAIGTDFNLLTIFKDMLIMFFLAILSTLYPILKVNKYTPIEAMHHV